MVPKILQRVSHMCMYRKTKVSVGVVPMLLAENHIPNTEYPLPAGHHIQVI
jgi:hypothetical protein